MSKYVLVLEDHDDDYKRPQTYVHVIDVFESRLEAEKTGWKMCIMRNAINAEDLKHKYFSLYTEIDNVAEAEIEKFGDKFDDLQEDFLGKAEFTMQSDGWRSDVYKVGGKPPFTHSEQCGFLTRLLLDNSKKAKKAKKAKRA